MKNALRLIPLLLCVAVLVGAGLFCYRYGVKQAEAAGYERGYEAGLADGKKQGEEATKDKWYNRGYRAGERAVFDEYEVIIPMPGTPKTSGGATVYKLVPK